MSDDLKPLPGPHGLPIFGSMFSLGEYRGRTLTEWANKYYGPVFKVRIGSREVLAIQGYDALHESMVEKAKSFAGRIEAPVLKAMRNNNGLFFVQYGEHWEVWRKFATNGISDICKQTRRAICREGQHLVEFMDGKVGIKMSLQDYFTATMANVVLESCLSKRYEIDDPTLTKLVDNIYKTSYDKKFGLLLFLPGLGKLFPFCSFLDEVKARRKRIIKQLTDLIHERREEEGKSPDLVSCYYRRNEEPSENDIKSLAFLFEDMLYAGSLTTGSECLWGILYLLRNPEKMAKLQQEVDSVLGDYDQPIELALQGGLDKLPYLQAVVEEAKRIRPIAPTSLFRETTEETSLMGFKVPKGMAVMPNLWSAQHDPEVFPDPEEFKPERFIDSDGKFEASKHVVAFGMGWRDCVGYKMANVEMQIFILGMVLNYNIELLTELSDEEMKGRFIGIMAPPHFKVKLTKR